MLADSRKEPERLLHFGAFTLDIGARSLCKGEERVHVTSKPLETLVFLVQNRGRLVTRQELLDRIWDGVHVSQNTLEQAIRELRKILADNPNNSLFIQTVHGQGYRFIAPVTETHPVRPEPSPASGVAMVPKLRSARLFRRHGVWAALLIGLIALAFWLRPRAAPTVVDVRQLTNSGMPKFPPIVSDGVRVYYNEDAGANQHRISVVSHAGGHSAELRMPFKNPFLSDISPDGGSLLVKRIATFRNELGELWIVPAVGVLPRRFGSAPAYEGSWSPDGTQIVYAADNSDLYLANADGTRTRKLISVTGTPWWPRWSPKGDRIRFTVYQWKTGANALWEVRSDGTSPQPVLPGWNVASQECCGSWTPDGKYFIFQSSKGGATNVWAMPEGRRAVLARASDPVRLTTGPVIFSGPALSRDGKRIFVRGKLNRTELVRFEPATRRFESMLPGISPETLAVSPDGQSLVYSTVPENTLWRSRWDGSGRLQLTAPPARAAMPQWSPDGRFIAYMRRAPTRPWKICMIPASGGEPQELLNEDRNQADPTWSPASGHLAFGRMPTLEDSPQSIAIHVLDISTRQVSTLPGSEGLFSPRWSPDGRFLAAMSADAKSIKIFSFSTQQWTRLVDADLGYPSWSADSKHVYYLKLGREPGIARVGIQDGIAENVASLNNIRQPSTTFGWWIGLAPGGSPLAVRDLSTDEIYRLDLQVP
ncbi:MAG: winged helix-turn-helix domain-containing protein [Bryobacteraceae bacterium]